MLVYLHAASWVFILIVNSAKLAFPVKGHYFPVLCINWIRTACNWLFIIYIALKTVMWGSFRAFHFQKWTYITIRTLSHQLICNDSLGASSARISADSYSW